MKKIISSLLVIVILFNFILSSSVYATDFKGTDSIDQNSITAKDQEMITNEGKVEDKSGMTGDTNLVWDLLGAIFGTIAGILAVVANLFPMLVQIVMTGATGIEGLFTVEKVVFNQVGLFNINYFNFDDEYTVGTDENEKVIKMDSTITTEVKKSVAKFYIILRLIAVALSLVILIYVGIRMALSTVSSDKAKYKKMLLAWLESIVILFLLQYIISFTINIGEMFVNLVYDIKCAFSASGEVSFEEDIIETLVKTIQGKGRMEFCSEYHSILVFSIYTN